MRFPAVFVNHGGGPLPLLGQQPNLVEHMKEVARTLLPEKPTSIVVVSAHWESDPVKITSSPKPKMLFDYYGFPPETYKYEYNAPGSPELAAQIQNLLDGAGIDCELDDKRGFDHGVFIPLMMMYPEADIPVVCVSLHSSLAAETHINIGKALRSLREEGTLILGSGYTFHNLPAMFNPTKETHKAATDFNEWLKSTMLSGDDRLDMLRLWTKAPGARIAHPREEHLLPLFMTAASAVEGETAELIFDVEAKPGGHAVSGYLFR